MINCIHLIPVDGLGGVETAARSFIRQRGEDHLLNLKVMYIASGVQKERPGTAPGVIRSGFASVNNPLAYLGALLRLFRERPRILVCSLWRTMPVGILYKLVFPSSRLVCFLHSMRSIHLPDQFLNNLAMCLSDAIWSDSETTLELRVPGWLRRRKRVRSISFLLESYLQEQLPGNSPSFVYWGRLHYLKGVDRAVRFFAAISRGCPGATFTVYGPDDGELASLRELCHTLGVAGRVYFAGVTSFEELKGKAGSYSYYLQLSRCEGMAISVVESMQLGLVPVISPVGEISNYCNHGNALIIADPEHPERHAEEVLRVLQDSDLYKKLQHNSVQVWKDALPYRADILSALHELA